MSLHSGCALLSASQGVIMITPEWKYGRTWGVRHTGRKCHGTSGIFDVDVYIDHNTSPETGIPYYPFKWLNLVIYTEMSMRMPASSLPEKIEKRRSLEIDSEQARLPP
ncbi:hypothetical protein M422DRAFT_241462 [Sphaerobolus stellatus SS14]|nr:hypothetical protein M422DRAFT_241462 [Sphaerobolus stellatus SS14]